MKIKIQKSPEELVNEFVIARHIKDEILHVIINNKKIWLKAITHPTFLQEALDENIIWHLCVYIEGTAPKDADEYEPKFHIHGGITWPTDYPNRLTEYHKECNAQVFGCDFAHSLDNNNPNIEHVWESIHGLIEAEIFARSWKNGKDNTITLLAH